MESLVQIPIDHTILEGKLLMAPKAEGLILFVHGSGSSRHSPRNNYVATILHEAGFATLLIDLLSEKEDSHYETRFHIHLLTDRVIAIVKWLENNKNTKELPLGFFGASTGAAAALEAAAALKDKVKAIVSRGGRPDLAFEILSEVSSPTLLIVGSIDFTVLELNQKALKGLKGVKALKIVPGASHLFEEPGCLDEIARLAKEWFKTYLITP